MADTRGARDTSAQLGADVRKRWQKRKAERQKKLGKVDREGVFAAAERTSALRRTVHMSRTEGRPMLFEQTIGSDDTDHVYFLGRGILAARAVCRLVQDGQPVGTGFLVAPGLLLTNHHVIESAVEARLFVAEFDYELGLDEQPRTPIVRFSLDPDRAFVTSPAKGGRDFTFVAVGPTSSDGAFAIDAFGWLPMDEQRDKILEGEPAVIIQHPRGEPKRLCLFSAELVDRFDHYIHYTTDTDGGSSGSPVFNRGWQLIGLHHAATTSDRTERGHPIVVNEGIRVSSILQELRADNGAADHRQEVWAAISAPAVIGNGRPQAPRAPVAATPAAAVIAPEGTAIRSRPADWFAGRDRGSQGYRSDFLGIDVPLPRVSPSRADDVAKSVVDGATELTYTHFSVVHSIPRRLPILTGVNIDGARLHGLGRKDRHFEAADTWYYDPRIPQSVQLGPEVYDGTAFDFGHMVRRGDPVWGDLNTARMANDDSFYMTNCAPQHESLNRGTWLRLEDAMLASARVNRVRISVFTGPILSATDPVVRGVQVPTGFWKIVAYVGDDGKLCAHGFEQRRPELVEDVLRHERLSELEPAAQDQVPIRDIAADTGLDFGPLVAADRALGATPSDLEGRPTRREGIDDSFIPSLFLRIGRLGAPTVPRPRAGESDGPPLTHVEH